MKVFKVLIVKFVDTNKKRFENKFKKFFLTAFHFQASQEQNIGKIDVKSLDPGSDLTQPLTQPRGPLPAVPFP